MIITGTAIAHQNCPALSQMHPRRVCPWWGDSLSLRQLLKELSWKPPAHNTPIAGQWRRFWGTAHVYCSLPPHYRDPLPYKHTESSSSRTLGVSFPWRNLGEEIKWEELQSLSLQIALALQTILSPSSIIQYRFSFSFWHLCLSWWHDPETCPQRP